MFHPLPALRLALLSLLASGAAVAQTHVHSHSDAPSHAHAHAHATAEPAPLAYGSAFDGYRPFADDKPIPWTQANGAAEHSAGHSGMTAAPAAGSAGIGRPDPHAGHAMPMAMPMSSQHRAQP